MILQRLSELYERLRDDERVEISRKGYSEKAVALEVVLELDGRLHDLRRISSSDDPRKGNIPMIVPGSGGRTSKSVPSFLCDNTDYVLGWTLKKEHADRAAERHRLFKDLHLSYEAALQSAPYQAVCRFLRNWDPAAIDDRLKQTLSTAPQGNIVFTIVRSHRHVHQDEEIVKFWNLIQSESADADARMCLVTGRTDEAIAGNHEPKIKHVRGAEGGVPLVSVDGGSRAYHSYGSLKNPPVNRSVVFAYCTALNYLLRKGSTQKVQIGDATTVFWTGSPTPVEESLGLFLNEDFQEFGSADSQDRVLLVRANAALSKLSRGLYPNELGEPDVPFYILGLMAPNKGRLVVRFWHASTLGRFIERLGGHVRDVSIESSNGSFTPSCHTILKQTAKAKKPKAQTGAGKASPPRIPPHLSGALMRAVLEGTAYPAALFQALILRIRAGDPVNAPRAGAIKAYLNRNIHFRSTALDHEVSMSLDPERPEAAYQLGRLFAVLEKVQKDSQRSQSPRGAGAVPSAAQKKTRDDSSESLNATIKDRYFGAAMATPGSVFPRLIGLHQHHARKLEGGRKVVAEKRVQEIMGRLDGFPTHLPLVDQGLFAVGYYHQRQNFFQRKAKADDVPAAEG